MMPMMSPKRLRALSVRRNISSISGMVLVMTLIALAVMMILLLALFHGASHQVRGAQGDASLAREKMLADSAVALVIGQIEQASTQPNMAWISQPGLLRIYSTNSVRTPAACYKLYSTASLANMTDTSGNLNFFATDVPANWSSEPSQYIDLNSPAQTPGLFGGTSIYPILDPAATNNVTVIGVSSDTTSVAMPVAWLYQLQDGTLGPASNGTAANPIVARIAFWTDDDTCKININTAGCGSPWNTPRVNSTNDEVWSTNQPAEGEYSAYPGHPATTALAMALGTSGYSPQQLLGLTPRYAWGGSEFENQATTPGEVVPTKFDRLYASVDELGFSTNTAGNPLQRQTNPVSAAQLEIARFVLTAHSNAPETTLLGEPRFAIWPVADSTSASARTMTATDSAITNVATVGGGTSSTRSYFFQRHSAQNPTNDLTAAIEPSNAQMFGDLLTRGNETLPGYGTTMISKYPGAEWTQLMLEIADYIRSINAVDPSPSPFVPFAPGNATNAIGYGFVDPLMTNYGTGTSQITLRGIGRCPTLSSLTLVFYVCGFNFDAASKMSPIDFEATPDVGGTYWATNLAPSSTLWQHVTSELVRAFVVPCTFQPGCGYPEVGDNCILQITGLNTIGITTSTSNDFGFQSTPLNSDLLGASLGVTPTDRAWGGNEGPLAWRAAALDARQATPFTYTFAGTKPLAVTLSAKPSYNAGTGVFSWLPPSSRPTLQLHAASLTVVISDGQGNALQTLSVSLPSSSMPAPMPMAEFSQDGSGNPVAPSYYMTLKNRVLLTQANREFLIQPNDISRSVEAATDMRVIAGLSSVPSIFFKGHPLYTTPGTMQAHNLHFADGTAVFGATGTTCLVKSTTYANATNSVTWTDWSKNGPTNYAWPVSAPCSCPTTSGNGAVTMLPLQNPQPSQNINGDWDTGLGFSADGAQINLPDAGTTNSPATAYFSLSGGSVGAPTQRTPNALVPSPVIFGSLPAGINPANPASVAAVADAALLSLSRRRILRARPMRSIPVRPVRPIISSSIISGCPSSSLTPSAPAWPRRGKSISTTRSRRSPICIATPRCTRCSTICAFRPFPVTTASTYKSSGAPASSTFGIRSMKTRPSRRSKTASPTAASTPI